MSKKQQPFLPMFVGDFFAATAEWDGEEEALYALLLMRQWALGHLPIETPKLARLVKYEQRNFERWWPTVSTKFELREVDGFGDRLMNPRLEQHRAKSAELSLKNSMAGKLGAEVKKRKQSERHPNQQANASGGSSERFQNASSARRSNPSHPIPSHPDPSQVLPPSPQGSEARTPSSGAGITRAIGARNPEGNGSSGAEGPPPIAPDTLALTDRLRAVYPPGVYRASNWLLAERELCTRLDEGVSADELVDAAAKYCAQQRAKGDAIGTQFVLSPENFFGPEGHWRGPFPLPAGKADTRLANNISAAEEFMRRTEAG